MANEDRLKLYKAINKAGFDIGNYDDFDRRMNNAEDRQKFFTAVNEAGYDIGAQEDFERRIGPSKYKISVNGNEVPVSEREYTDFLNRHPNGTSAKPQPQQQPAAQSKPQATQQSKPTAQPANTPPAPQTPVPNNPWVDQDGRVHGDLFKNDPVNKDASRFGFPYKPDTQMTAAQLDEVRRQNDFTARQLQKEAREQRRRNQPFVDTGSPQANEHIIKTQGEWDDDLQKGASRISSSVVAPAVDKAIADFDKKADEIWGKYNEQSKFVDSASPMSIAIGRQANEAKDPEKILNYLQQQMEGLYKDSAFVEEVGKEADRMGIDRAEYIEKVIKPQIQQDLTKRLTDTLVKRELPKSTAEYIMNGLSDSIIGMLYNSITESKGQRDIKNQAEAMTENGQNPNYTPDTAASLAKMGVSFAADAPFFGLYGKVSGTVAKKVAERQIQNLMAKGLSEGAARSIVGTALENSVGARMKNYLMQHVISSSLTLGGYNATSEFARQTRDKEGYDLGKIAVSTAEGMATGAAFGLTGGVAQALSQPLSGIAKVGAKLGSFGAEAETLYATEELAKMAQGEEGFENPFEGSVEALMKLGVMKASSPGGIMKIAGEIAHPIKNSQRQRTGVNFTPEEQEYIRNSVEGKNLVESLSAIHPELSIEEVNGKKRLTKEGEQQRRQLSDNYERFMTNTEIPAIVKQKVASMLGGVYRPGLETGSDIIHNPDGSVILKTRDKDGNCVRDLKFDSFSDAEQFRDTNMDEFRMNDAINMWNATTLDKRVAVAREVAEMYGLGPEEAVDMVSRALNPKDTSLDKEQYDAVFGAIERNAYPADELNVRRRYWEGQQLTPEERHFALTDAQVAEERLALLGQDFADEVIGAADYPDEKMAELAARKDITGEQLEAAVDYYNKSAVVQGMMEDALKNVDSQVEAANAYVQRNTHPDTGAMIEATAKGRNVYVTAGHFRLTPDGRIEMTDNSGMVIVRDKDTGEIEVVSPQDVLITGIRDPKQMMAYNDSMDGLRGELMRQTDDSIELNPETPTEAANGDMYIGADGRQYMAMATEDEMGNAVWSKIEVDENGEPVGEPMPFDMAEYRKAKSDEIDAANRPEEEVLEQPVPENTENAENNAQNLPENIQSGVLDNVSGENAPAEDGGQESNQTQSALGRIPVDEKGRPQFEQAKPEDTLAELTEKYGTEKAGMMIATMAENTASALEELSKKDVSKITDMADLVVHEDALAEAQRKAEYWKSLLPKENVAEVETVPETKQEVETPAQDVAPEVKPAEAAEPKTEPAPVAPVEPAAPIEPTASEPAEPEQPKTPSKQEKIFIGSANANIGRTFNFTDGRGIRSELTIDGINRDGQAVVTRRDFDEFGNQIGEHRQETYAATRVGEAILNSTWQKVKTYEEKLRDAMKGKPGANNIINVLSDEEIENLWKAYEAGDKLTFNELYNEYRKNHFEDLIAQEQRNRTDSAERTLGYGVREEKLRRLRRIYQGNADAELALSDEMMQPQSLEEYVSDLLGDVPQNGTGQLAYYSYGDGADAIIGLQDETGFGSRGVGGDTKGFNPWLAPKGKGMSLAKYAETLHSQLPEALQEQYTDQDVRNAVIEVLTSAEKPTDIPNMILRNRARMAEEAMRREEQDWIDSGIRYQKAPRDFATRLKRGIEQVNTEPSEAQKEAGNYMKGHVSFGGYDYTIENPAGSIRRGRDADGNEWEQKMNNTYGYILGKFGKDGDHLDMFINDKADLDNWNGNVYVVDQVNPKTGEFDEHKILYGFVSEAEAREAYLSNYEKGWKGLGDITGVPKETFDKWLDSSTRKQKEFADHSIIRQHMVERTNRAFDSALQKLDEREISIDDPDLLKEYGLKNVTLSKMGDYLTLTHFIAGEQGNGNGTRFMNDLARLADEKGWTLALTPDDSFGATSVKRLKDFYKRFGFVENRGRNTDFYTRESMLRRPKDYQPESPERREQMMRDAVVSHLRQAGIEVSDDWKEGQRILDEYNSSGMVKKMGSRVDSKKADLSNDLEDRDMDESQQAVADVYTGKKDNAVITVSRDGQDLAVTMRQGNENKAGTKHSLFRHYGTGVGVITADDVLRIPEVLANGERTEKQRGNVRLAQYRLTDESGKRYTVVNEIKNSGEVFNDFYTNKKASNQTPQMPNGDTPEGARTNDLNASGAKVQQNPETTKDSERKFFRTPDGQAYGYTYKGKIYLDPRIATSETPIHEYGHLWAEMKRQTSPDEWNEIKGVMLNDRLVQPIIDRVRRDYPELAKEGKEDDFVEEIITQFSGRRGAERLREIAQEIADENGGVFGKAEALTAMQRLKNILNRFWEGVAKMMGWKYTNANQIADRILSDMLNGVNPREAKSNVLKSQQEIERTLMGVHNLSEEKLRKALKVGGLANPSMAVVDIRQHMHTDYGDISLIPKASLIDARTGRNAGTFTADAWTPSYPQVVRRMTDKGQSKFWKDIRKLNEEAGEVASQMRMAFDTWLDKEAGQERLAYWYLSEKGMKPELILNENPYDKDVIKRLDELTDNGNKSVSSLPEDQIREIADMYHAHMEKVGEPVTPAEERIKKLEARIDPNKQSPFTKIQQFRLEELQKYGELLHNLSDFVDRAGRASFYEGKPNVGATIRKASDMVKQHNLQADFEKWLDQKAQDYGVEEWLFNGTDYQGRQKWVRNTLDNASKLMKKEGLNGAVGWSSLGSWIATVANKEKTLEGIRRNKKNLNTTEEEHDAWKEQWGEKLYPLVEKLGNGDVFHGDNILKDILEHKDFAGYYKREYGKELTKDERDLIDTFIKEVRTNFPTGYFETKFERPVMLDEFEIAVVPETTSPDIVEALKNAGLDVRTYDASDYEKKNENRTKAAMDAVSGRDDIMFQMVGKKGAEKADETEGNPERIRTLRVAKDAAKAGMDPKVIKLATGWEQGKDGQWRYEIPDADVDVLSPIRARLKEMRDSWKMDEVPKFKLGELLGEGNDLFKYYPELKDMEVRLDASMQEGTAGSYGEDGIEINPLEIARFSDPDLSNENVYGILLHEVQHAIQDIEGFARGGNLHTSTTEEGIKAIIDKKERQIFDLRKEWLANRKILGNPEELKVAAELEGKSEKEVKDQLLNTTDQQAVVLDTIRLQIERLKHTNAPSMTDARDLYNRLAGEVESRNVETRMKMTPEERRNSLASETEDVPRRDQAVIYGGNLGGQKELKGGDASEDEAPKFQRASNPEPELTPEERQYWNKWDADMKKWRERNGITEGADGPSEKPTYQRGESAIDYAKKLTQWNRERALWQTAPKLDDYRQKREDKDLLEAARENEKRYPDSPSAKMRRVAAEFQQIRRAMSQQKAYDKATVKAVTDFAQEFMKQGFGDNLSRGEMERMLSSVKNATGAKDIRQQIDNIMNILVDNQLRNLDQRVQKLSSTKELSKTAQGVEKQGKLELKGQRMIQAFRKAREERMTPEKIRERLHEVAEKMARNDDEAPMWEQEYEGLSIALQYAENIEGSREEYMDLDRAYKDAVESYKTSGRSYKAQQQLLESIDQARMENKIERIGLFGDIIGRLEGNIAESMEGAKEFVQREKDRVKHIQQIANFDLAGKDMGAMRENGKGKPANFFLQPLATFEQMLRQFGSRNANGEGYLYDYFMRSWMDSTDQAYVNELKAKEELDSKAREVFGDKVKRWSDLYQVVRDLPTMEVEMFDGEDPKTFTLNQGNLLYIYMADKMTDGRMKLRKMGIEEEDVQAIKDFLDPRLVELGDWLQDDYLVKKRTEYNKIHERMFGAPMAAIDHYFPINILDDARVQEVDVNVPDSETLPSTITGNIIKRKKNTLPLDILHTDALSLAIEHIEDMEQWAAQAEWRRDVNTLLGYTTFRNKVKNMNTIYGSGDALWENLKDAAKMAAGTYKPKAKPGSVDATISNIAKGVTAAKISFRIYTAFKQILSAPAFLHDVNLADFAKYSVNPYGSWKWAMENMPVFKKRWKSRQVGDTRLMDDPTDWKMWKTNIVKMASMMGMSPNALVDGVTCAVGARAIYDARYRKYKKIGATDEVARKRALQDAEIGYNLTQQSSEGAFVSRIQKDRTVAANMLSVFRNSSMAYTRQWVDAARNLKHRMQPGYKEDSIKFMTKQLEEQFNLDEAQAKKAAEAEYARAGRRDVARLLNMMFGVTMAWNLGASLPYLLIGDDNETKKEMLTDALLRGLVAGPTEGFAAGNLWSELMSRSLASEETRNTIRKEGWGAGVDSALKQGGDYEINPLPLMADLQGMIKKMGYDKFAAAQDVFNIAAQSAVGVNPQTFTDMWNAIMDYAAPGWDGHSYNPDDENFKRPKELALFMMRLLNAPTSSWRNKYIDELGMNAEDAKKLPYEEMAKRYAHYKHWKDAPIMGWLRGEEGRATKIEKLQKQFDKAVEERMQRLSDKELESNIFRSQSTEEKRKYAKIAAQRLGLTPANNGDSKKADDSHWYQELYQQHMLYEDIKEDETLAAKMKDLRDDEAKKEINKRLDWIRDGKYDTESGRKGKRKKGNEPSLIAPGKKQLANDEKQNVEDILKNIRKWRKEALEIALRAESENK